jgi:hypothetical protein
MLWSRGKQQQCCTNGFTIRVTSSVVPKKLGNAGNEVQQNSVNPNRKGPDGSRIIEYSDYQKVTVLTYLQKIFVTAPILGLGCSHLLVQGHRGPLLFSRKASGIGDQMSGGTIVDVRHSWGSLWTCPWDLPFHWWSFLLKRKTSHLGPTLLKCRIIRISELLDVGLKEFCCIYVWIYVVCIYQCYHQMRVDVGGKRTISLNHGLMFHCGVRWKYGTKSTRTTRKRLWNLQSPKVVYGSLPTTNKTAKAIGITWFANLCHLAPNFG